MINEFSDFYAEVIGNVGRTAFTLDDEYGDDEYRYVPYFKIEIYGIPNDTDERSVERILDGETDGGKHIATLLGNLVLNSAMIRKGFSSVKMCDDYSYELGYAMKALTEDDMPLSEAYDLEMCSNLFYIYDLEFENPYQDGEFKTEIIRQIPNILLYTLNVYPDMLLYYPSPMPYEKDKATLIKEGIAHLAADEARKRLAQQMEGDYVDDGKPHLILSEEQLNIVMRTRNPGDTYPASAINREEWEIYENAGFTEVGNSRLLYAWVDEM